MNIQLQVTLPSGKSTVVDIKPVFEHVMQGGQKKKIVAPMLDTFETAYDHISDFTTYRGAFEVIHYLYIEGSLVTGEIESSDDEILATWKFLVNGEPVDFDQLKEALEYSMGITKSKKIETIESSSFTWQIFPSNPETDGSDGLVNTYCVDGDGIVVVLESANGHFYLVDQEVDVCDLGTDKMIALEKAQTYLQTTYSDIY